MSNITKHWKTTLIGILFFIGGFGYIFLKEDHDLWITVLLFALGVVFLFIPDDFISGLRSLIQSNKERKL